ncbi:hypothetical protein COY14_00845 [Candidatus Roizmanbacteria bacterium CG_4_10_14_0_2_um_filter_36_9]|uniref:EfeO-type cupredoxin-like domain-containing protein n=1 Tax=Candidatus Roizmanbacteria bacterium CG_4_10_14_0_2_um_filter_36_9 TaxID=1974823 RepID=A0A2M7U5I5_9BACT|nr:MAG: hypothetical protein COY14_00845 [Candidatus Roizmanbacteria bacterium CG_4_10_14_0_2_um_filter_36_9]
MNEMIKKSNPMIVIGIVVVMVLLIVGYFMMNGNGESMENEGKTESVSELMMEEDQSITNENMMNENQIEGVTTIEVNAGSFYYEPTVMKAKKGDKIRLVFYSIDMMHDFNIDELGVKVPVTKAGVTSTIEFTADTVGTFEYYCSVGNHRAQGQVGTLIIE